MNILAVDTAGKTAGVALLQDDRLLAGDTVREAVDFGMNLYGADDIIWYNNQGGRRPHAVASFPVLSGNQDARLRAVQAAADSMQQAA